MSELIDKINHFDKILIEASAGTGKTYTLEHAITSLLASKIYSPSEILVLTFTKKATEEMHIRILKTIETTYQNSKTNKLLKEIYEQSSKIFISTIHKFALHSLNNFQIETENFSKYKVKHFTSEIDEIIYEFLRKSDTLCKELSINSDEFEIFKSNFKYTKDMIENIKQGYKRDKTKELGSWIEKQTMFQNILTNKDRLVHEYTLIIEELNCMTMEERRTFLDKHRKGISISEIKYSNEQDIVKIADVLTNNKFFSKVMESNLKKNTTLSDKELKIKTALRNLSHATNTDTEDKDTLKRYIRLKVEYKILKYIEKELTNTINATSIIDQRHIIINFKTHLKSPDRKLLNSIKNRYKIILIDEAQDLNLIQIEIFEMLNSCGIKLVFIADPKQIIYAFRNADVSFYKQGIKHKITHDARITLATNYRANKKLVEPLNIMFDNLYNKTETSTIEQIEFIKSSTNLKNDNNNIFINEQEIEGINIIETGENENTLQKTALTIKYLLTNGKIYDNNQLRRIKESDIKILCRTGKEIDLICKILKNQDIQTNKIEDVLFKTKEFSEILYLIKCLDKKQGFQTLNYVLTSKIINLPWELYLDFLERDAMHYIEELISDIIYSLENKEITLIKAIETIISNKDLWINLARTFKSPTLTKFANAKKSYKETLINEGNLEELKNYEASLDFISKIYYEERNIESLISALEELIINQDIEEDEDNTTFTDSQSIEILTIHKAKGLSFNIVFLVGDLQKNTTLLKNSETFYKFCLKDKIEYDFLKLKENQKFATHKALNEEKNIFYVGTTRPRFALFIVNKGSTVNKLLELADIKTIDGINQDFNIYTLLQTHQFNKLDINYHQDTKLLPPTAIDKTLFRKEYTHSYTSLASLYKSIYHTSRKIEDAENYANDTTRTKETLPKGKDIGNILHAVMEEINFSDAKDTFNNFQKMNINLIQKKIKYFNSNLNTAEIQESLTQMIYNILSTRIKFINARLCDIQELQKEMEFLMKIDIKANIQNSPIKSYKELDLNLNNGYIKGIIDLIFKINNKVYILDYKTNYLGQNPSDYNLENLKKIMTQEQYDLQYKIYALGIKKILFRNIETYNKNFGGIVYLFTRAFQENPEDQLGTQNGIYSSLPNFQELDLEQIYLQLKT
ncbi:exodeoxyribonuclease V subunit beta [Candidatus Borreliella tachyglossi]|uniref:exodeoxyribonuclease V subunit beta n=1 Tax=Candidatus Borreliella tachyglossi TaxID=1964448 RepID=UPI00404212CF